MCREHADRMKALAQQAERHDSCVTMEPLCEEMLAIAVSHPDCRARLAEAFVEATHYVHEAVEFCMHTLRWEEVHDAFTRQLKASLQADDWRAIPVLQSLLASFRDDWQDRDLWPRFR